MQRDERMRIFAWQREFFIFPLEFSSVDTKTVYQITLKVLPVLAWSRCRLPMLVCFCTSVATFSNSSQSTSPSPFKSNRLEGENKCQRFFELTSNLSEGWLITYRNAISKWRFDAENDNNKYRWLISIVQIVQNIQ